MPDPVDYLGAPKIITGTDYMHALAALGYNVENMSSPLPTMTKIAEAGTNFLDSIYNQNMKAQQSQADLKYKLAQTQELDSVTDYNNRSLDLRLADLKTQSDWRKQQMDFAEQAQPFKQRELERQDQEGKLRQELFEKQTNDLLQGQAALPGALQTLPDPEKDPNFKTNFDNWQSTNAGLLARQDSIGDQARRMRDTVKTRYEGTSRFHQNLADIAEFEGYQGKGTINRNYDPDKMVFGNPDQAQAELVRARALDAQSELQEILFDPRVPQAYRDKLNDVYTYVHNFVTSDTGAQDIQKGKASDYFNPDGKLNSTARAMIDGVKALRETKPLEATARLPILGLTGKVGKGEAPYEDVKGTQEQVQQREIEQRAQQVAEQQRAAEMQDVPDTPENLVDKAAHQRGEISLEELHRRVNERMKTKPSTLPGNRRIPGMQGGGLVSGAPGPDQVPAMLTSGEYVIPKDAVQDIGLPTLEALAGRTTGVQQDATLALNTGYTGTGGTQQDVQFQQPQQPSAFQQLFGQSTSQYGTTDAPAAGQLPYIPVRNQIPVIRPQPTQPTQPTQPAQSAQERTQTPTSTTQPAPPTTPRAELATQHPALTEAGNVAEMPLDRPAQAGAFTLGRGDNKIQGVILHSSDGRMAGDLVTLTGGDPSHRVSANYYVARDGTVHHMVADANTAYHAGQTTNNAVYGNAATLGIEQEHFDPGGKGGKNGEDWPDAQVRATASLTARLLLAHGLSLDSVLGHSDIAPERKQDPYNYPWATFNAYLRNAYVALGGTTGTRLAAAHMQGGGFVGAPGTDTTIRTTPVVSSIPSIFPLLTQATPASPVIPSQTPAPLATAAQTPAVTTGAATLPISSTGGTTMMPQYTTGDFALNAHYLGDGRLSGMTTNFGHDVNGKPDTYMLSKLGGGSRLGAFGTDVVNPTTSGVSIPVQTVRAFIGNEKDPQVRQRIKSGQVQVEVTAPNGRTGRFNIVDLGPGKGENASLDMTGTAMRQLGMTDNFGAVYRIVSY
jgi:N-acetyl-anhydromuramyl-L-alanine amidase AmpD